MGETEQKLKELIISKYGSLNKFCEAINMPWTTLDSILKRGISKANITNIMKITKELNIDTESLAFGIISEKSLSNASDLDENFKDIYKYYKDLNEAGQAEALKRIYELLQISYYAKTNALPIPNAVPLSTFIEQHREDVPADKRVAPDTLLNAAHAILNSSKADQKHDDDIMDDENF